MLSIHSVTSFDQLTKKTAAATATTPFISSSIDQPHSVRLDLVCSMGARNKRPVKDIVNTRTQIQTNINALRMKKEKKRDSVPFGHLSSLRLLSHFYYFFTFENSCICLSFAWPKCPLGSCALERLLNYTGKLTIYVL